MQELSTTHSVFDILCFVFWFVYCFVFRLATLTREKAANLEDCSGLKPREVKQIMGLS